MTGSESIWVDFLTSSAPNEFANINPSTLSKALQSLETNSLNDLSASLSKVDEELASIDTEIKSIAFKNYNSYLDEINVSSLIVDTIPQFQDKNKALTGKVKLSLSLCMDTVGRLNKKNKAFQSLVGSLENSLRIADIFQIPKLLQDAITERRFADCFRVFDFIQECQLEEFWNLVGLIQSEISYLERYLEFELVRELSSDLSIANCIDVVINLKRISRMSEEEIRMLFLQSRSLKIMTQVSAIAHDENHTLASRAQSIIEFLDIVKDQIFDSISNYKAIFFNMASTEDQTFEGDLNKLNISALFKEIPKEGSNQTVNGFLHPSVANEAILASILKNWTVSELDSHVEKLACNLRKLIDVHLSECRLNPVQMFTYINEIFEKCDSLLEMLQRMKLPFISADCQICEVFDECLKKIIETHLNNILHGFSKSIETTKWTPVKNESCNLETNLPSEIIEYPLLMSVAEPLNKIFEALKIIWASPSTSFLLEKIINFFESSSAIITKNYQINLQTKPINWRKGASKMVQLYRTRMIPYFIDLAYAIVDRGDDEFDHALSFVISKEIIEQKVTFVRQCCSKAAAPIQDSIFGPNTD